MVHGGNAEDGLTLGVEVSDHSTWLEVRDSGTGGAIDPRAPGSEGGFGLYLVQALSERWGVERTAGSGTRVWVQLSHDSPIDSP